MKIEEAMEEFKNRLYDWLISDFYREIEQGYPIWSTISGEFAQDDLHYFKSISKEEQLITARASVLASRSQSRNLEVLKPNEYEAFMKFSGGRAIRNWQLHRHEMEITVPTMTKKEVANMVISHVKESFGNRGRKYSSLGWGLEVELNKDWSMGVGIDFSSRFGFTANLGFTAYRKDLFEYNKMADPNYGIGMADFSILVGTDYKFKTDSDIPPAMDSIVTVIKHVSNAIPALVVGLDKD